MTPAREPAEPGVEGTREYPTSDVASMLGLPADMLRKWKARGLLKLAPVGVAGQGRGVECMWSEAAIREARTIRDSRKRSHARTRFRSRLATPSDAPAPSGVPHG